MEGKLGVWGIVRGAVVAILLTLQSWIMGSVASGSLIGIGTWRMGEIDIAKLLIKHGIWLFLLMGLLILAVHIYTQWVGNKSRMHATLNRICENIFDMYVRDVGVAGNHEFKVSFLLPKQCRKRRFSLRKNGERLYVRGRHQTKHGQPSSRASFCPGEGCAGKAYAENRTIKMKLDRAYDHDNPQWYYDECREKWGLSEATVKQLNEKVAYVLSIPIRYHGKDRVVGVVSIDCMVPVEIPGPVAKRAEHGITHYSALFKLKEAT